MSFADPWVLAALLLIPGLVIAYRAVRARRAARRAQEPATAWSSVSAPATGRLAPILLLVGLGLLVAAAARPQASMSDVRREGTVILAFDTSASMTATDVQPNRLDAARSAAKDLVDRAPEGVRIAIVGFGDSGVIMSLPTHTREDSRAAIDRLRPAGGTSLGQGIFASVKAAAGGKLDLPDSALSGDVDSLDIGYVGSALVVLLSDGEDRSRLDPLKLAELASVAGVRVDTVGIGDPAGTTVTIDGFTQATTLDEQMLRGIAQRTGGTYHPAADAAALADVYRSVDLRLTATPAPTDVSALVIGAALLALVLGAARAVLRTGRLL